MLELFSLEVSKSPRGLENPFHIPVAERKLRSNRKPGAKLDWSLAENEELPIAAAS